MKLQRNNKYNKRIACGLMSLVIGAGLLQGCKDNSDIESTYLTEQTTFTETTTFVEEPTEFVEPTIEPTEDNELGWKKLSPDELEREIEKLKVVSDDNKYNYSTFFTIMFNDANGNSKVMMATIDGSGDCYYVNDLFTGTKLFEYYSYEEYEIDNLIKENIEIHDENQYFTGATNVSIDVAMEMLNCSLKMGVEYDEELYLSYFPQEFYSDELFLTLNEMAEIYVTFTPKKFRVNAADLGLDYTTEEDKVYSIGGRN